ncbi:MAG: FAD-dependent oxidoreductase, partial [Planctomycetia bacterium]|nr:FAD-dependent oxidoreductase [Planctomycetia bacterium]
MKYDLIVIGGGPGGYVAAIRASQLGMRVALVERDKLGGTCLNRGCIPTKAYHRQATLLRMLPRLDQFNIYIDSLGIVFDMAGAVTRKNKLVDQMVEGVAGLLKSNDVDVIEGTAEILSPESVLVRQEDDPELIPAANNGEGAWDNLISAEELAIDQEKTLADGGPVILETDRILIATGSNSQRLSLPGIDLDGVMDSTAFLNYPLVPQKLVVIGGGVIGIEFASIYRSFGSNVTIIEALDRILPSLDSELYKRLAALYKRQGITIQTSSRVKEIRRATEDELELVTETPKGELVIPADAVLVAVGRRPHTEGLGLDKLGVKTLPKGFVEVDESYQTSVPGIYAIGDVAGKGMLAHLASEEGR